MNTHQEKIKKGSNIEAPASTATTTGSCTPLNINFSEQNPNGEQTEKSTNTPDSTTGDNPKRTHGFGIWNNPRVPIGIRVDSGLKNAFDLASRALFGSTCLPIECFMASVIGAYQTYQKLGVSPSTTVNIGEIKIERNLRERRKLVIEEEVETSETVTVKFCSVARCLSGGKGAGVAVARLLWLPRNEEFAVCDMHLKEATNPLNPLSKNWKVLSQ
jgi:hypothetical protein